VVFIAQSVVIAFFFSSRRRHTRFSRDWSSDVCSSDLPAAQFAEGLAGFQVGPEADAAHGVAFGHGGGRDPGGGGADERAGDPELAAGGRRHYPCPSYTLGTRDPILVTIACVIVPRESAQSCAVGAPWSPGPNRTTCSPARSGSSPTSIMNWSMQTRPATRLRLPPASTSARSVAWRSTPSA